VLRNPSLLPPGVECRPLDAGTYALRLPGQQKEARITSKPDVFDEHFESHQLLHADAPLFRQLLALHELGDERLLRRVSRSSLQHSEGDAAITPGDRVASSDPVIQRCGARPSACAASPQSARRRSSLAGTAGGSLGRPPSSPCRTC